jgi:epoxyqueuosine reductase
VIEESKALGFDLIGFAKVEPLTKEGKRLKEWLTRGYHADMNYMPRNYEKRIDVSKIFPGAKSVISLGMNYYSGQHHTNQDRMGKISKYAWGKDYHLVIWEKLKILESRLREIDSNFKSKSYIDTGPVMDKAWAVRAGLGWLGKHTNVINRRIGSWFFIANIITNYEFTHSEPIPDFCGSCTACIDACPTGAIVSEYVVDSNKCISYLTIENKGEINKKFSGKFDNWLFGCDICQDVCPWNQKFSVPSDEENFYPKSVNAEVPLEEISCMTEGDFQKKFNESPVKRTKLSGLKRNASFLSEQKIE